MRDQRILFDLTQDGVVIGKKIQRIYPEFDVSAFVSDVRAEMERHLNVSANGSRTQTPTFVCSWRHRSAHAA